MHQTGARPTIGSLLAQNEKSNGIKLFLMGIAITMALLVGISRVYLRAHWASDVIAGWLGGCAWAILFWLLENYILSRRQKRKTT